MPTVENLRAGRIRLFGGVVLSPGTNTVATDAWDACVRNPVTQHYLTRREIRVQGPKDPPPQQVSVADPVPDFDAPTFPIWDLRARDAKHAISRCTDIGLLDIILQNDTRPTVRSAADRRKAELYEGR